MEDLHPRYWKSLEVPTYKLGKYNGWLLEVKGPAALSGYWSPIVFVEGANVLSRDGRIWISDTPLERESQEPHVACAQGHVVIGGLGMGVALYNIIQKPNVRDVTVAEIDDKLINAFYQFADPESWNYWEKVTIINTDIMALTAFSKIDYLYVDIWATLGAERALLDTQQIVANLIPRKAGLWGQEIEFVLWAVKHGIKPTALEKQHWELFTVTTKIPFPKVSQSYIFKALSATINQVSYLMRK